MTLQALILFIVNLFPTPTNHAVNVAELAAPIIMSELAQVGSDVDPKLVAAMIMVESSYHSDAVSIKGAVGWMGVMPSNPRAVKFTKKQLIKPRINVRIGLQIIEDSRRSCRRIVEDILGYTDPRIWLSRYAGYGCQESTYADNLLRRVQSADDT